MTQVNQASSSPDQTFSTDKAGLAEASATEVLRLRPGNPVDLCIAPVAKRIGDEVVRMLAYNGSIPGRSSTSRRDRSTGWR